MQGVNQLEVEKILKQALFSSEKSYCGGDEDDTTNWYATLVDALESVVFYNGLKEMLIVAKEHLEQCYRDGRSGFRPDKLCDTSGFVDEEIAQFEVFWMIMSEMFGSCGTSPRYGWIDHDMIPVAIKFIDLLTPEYPEQMPF